MTPKLREVLGSIWTWRRYGQNGELGDALADRAATGGILSNPDARIAPFALSDYWSGIDSSFSRSVMMRKASKVSARVRWKT